MRLFWGLGASPARGPESPPRANPPRRPPNRRYHPGQATRALPRHRGPLTIGVLAVAYAALWLVARLAGELLARHLGQLFGGESVLLFSVALVVISTLPHVEQVFGGIDYAAIWHRRLAIAGSLLLLPHVELASNPKPPAWERHLLCRGRWDRSALIVWAILPRWRTMLPAAVHGLVTRTRDSWPVKAGDACPWRL